MKLFDDKPLLANPDVVFREEEEGAFLFHPETGDLKCLNLMGSAIWSLCDGSNTARSIEKKIASQYPNTTREGIHDDLVAFLEDLLDVGYIGHDLTEAPSVP